MTYGLGESVIADRIADWEAQLPAAIKLAYLPSLGRVRLRLSTKGTDAELLHSQVDEELTKLRPLIEDVYYGEEEDEPIEVLIGKQLQTKGHTLAVAESCTGGLIASRITTHPGASAFPPPACWAINSPGARVSISCAVRTGLVSRSNFLADMEEAAENGRFAST